MPKSDILLTNTFYPSGLTEGQAQVHYLKNSNRIIKKANKRPVLTFIYTETNKYIVKRNGTNGEPFVLTHDNFERIVHSRVVGLSVELPLLTPYWCLDIDAKENGSEKKKQECVREVLEFLKTMNEVESHQITTSSTSYHIYAHLHRKQHVISSRAYVKKQLLGHFGNQYNVDSKGRGGSKINIDLSPMARRGSHTILHGLNLNGLKCIDVTDSYERLNRRRLKA